MDSHVTECTMVLQSVLLQVKVQTRYMWENANCRQMSNNISRIVSVGSHFARILVPLFQCSLIYSYTTVQIGCSHSPDYCNVIFDFCVL